MAGERGEGRGEVRGDCTGKDRGKGMDEDRGVGGGVREEGRVRDRGIDGFIFLRCCDVCVMFTRVRRDWHS